MKVIYLGAGGFWTIEAIYKQLKGVHEVVPGYMGGTVANPTHETVATGTTGHAEVVKVTYDENVIDLKDILHIFYAMHDGSIPNHPPLGVGSQYRSVIFYTEEAEAEPSAGSGSDVGVIPRIIQQLQNTLPEGVTVSTQVMSAREFYNADESHYDYFQQHPEDAYSVTIIEPKLQEVKKRFGEKFQ